MHKTDRTGKAKYTALMLFIGLLRRREPAAHKTHRHAQEGRILQHRRGVLLHNGPCLHPTKRHTMLVI